MTAKTILYVGCGLTNAPESFVEEIMLLKTQLKEKYDVLEFVGTIRGTAEEVYTWDIEHCVASCDLFIAICDFPSIGLGWELCEAVRNGKPVLGLAQENAEISRLVLGAAALKPNFEFKRYKSLALDVPKLVGDKLTEISNI